MLAIDGVRPSTDTIRNRTYPLASKVYVVVRTPREKGHQAHAVRDWMLSPDGQKIVEKSGYVPIGSATK